MKILALELWQRNRKLRRQLRQATERAARAAELEAEIRQLKEAHRDEISLLAQQVNESGSRAAAEHWKAFKWGTNYQALEMDLAATRTERDLAFERARELSARVAELEATLRK